MLGNLCFTFHRVRQQCESVYYNEAGSEFKKRCRNGSLGWLETTLNPAGARVATAFDIQVHVITCSRMAVRSGADKWKLLRVTGRNLILKFVIYGRSRRESIRS